MVELDDPEARNLGKGLAFSQYWDYDVEVGSIDIIDGFDVLARDLSFAFTREYDGIIGDKITAETREDIAVAAKNVANRDSRVERVVPPVEVTKIGSGTVEVRMTLVANTDERGEAVLKIPR